MICPHCGKELYPAPFVDPMQHVNGRTQQPIYLNLANGANANGFQVVIGNDYNLTVCAAGAAAIPPTTFIKF